MLNISSIARQEKNKLHTDSAFIVLARIVPPASTGVSEICIAHNNEDIVWQGKLWQAFPFGIGDSKADNTGSEPSIEFKVSNVSRTLTYLLEQAGGGTGSKVYIYVVNTAEIKGENQHSAGLADPTFTRSSTAYDDSGSVVAANVPRMSGRGLLIEQEFNNLALNGDFSDGTSNWTANTMTPIVVSGNTASYTVTARYGGITQYVANYTNYLGHILYFSCYYKTDSYYNYLLLDDGTTQNIVYGGTDNQFHLRSGVMTISTAAKRIYIKIQDARTSDWTETQCKDFKVIDLTAMFGAGKEPTAAVCDLLFNKPIYGDKKADLFEIPAEVIPNGPWTIEFDAQTNSFAARNCVFFDTRGNTKGIGVCAYIVNSNGNLIFQYDTGTTSSTRNCAYTTIYVTDNLKHRYKFSYDGSNIKIYLDGVLKYTIADIQLYYGTASVTNYFVIGKSVDNYYVNGYISNLRISNVCRPDNDTTPAVDSHTTYYMPLTDNLNFTADAELEEQYTVGKTSVDENWVTFTLGAGYSLRTRRPFYRYMKNSCPFKYKGTRCACTSSEATCRHTLADCRSRGNSKRYGGFPGIDQKGLYLE